MSDPEKVRQMREELKKMANQVTNKVLNDNPNIQESREVIYEKAVKNLLVKIIAGELHLENYSQDYLKKSAEAILEEKGIRLTKNEVKNLMGGGRRKKRKTSVPKRYVPKQLSKKDKKKQAKELKKSRQAYKKGKYYTRKKQIIP